MSSESRFIATPSEKDIAAALITWPELIYTKLQPLLVTAMGDIYVELENGTVLVADTLGLQCSRVAGSVSELSRLISDRAWAEEHLLTNLVLLAAERGLSRKPHEVFAIAPHPCFTQEIRVENLTPMDVQVWHHLCSQFRLAKAGQG